MAYYLNRNYIVSFLLLLAVLTLNAQTTKSVITKTIVPAGWSNIPVVDSEHVKGGVHSVVSVSDRNSIPKERRRPGMFVYVSDSDKTFQLQCVDANIENNSNWKELTLSDDVASVLGLSDVLTQTGVTNPNSAADNKIIFLGDPTESKDATNKEYVDKLYTTKLLSSYTDIDCSEFCNFRINSASTFELSLNLLTLKTRTYTYFVKNTSSVDYEITLGSMFKAMHGTSGLTVSANKVLIIVGIADSGANEIFYTTTKEQ